jgi:hypothetical protein
MSQSMSRRVLAAVLSIMSLAALTMLQAPIATARRRQR